MSQQYIVNLNLVVLSIDKVRGKQYILSKHPNNIVLPILELNNDIRDKDLGDYLIKHLQTMVFTNELELIPQLINLHSSNLPVTDNCLNTVYGFVINYIEHINNAYWIEFNYTNPTSHSLLIFETIQKLK
jgi:hypothetical protein